MSWPLGIWLTTLPMCAACTRAACVSNLGVLPGRCLCALSVCAAWVLPMRVRPMCDAHCLLLLCALPACAVRPTLALLGCSSYVPVRFACLLYALPAHCECFSCTLCVLPSEARTSDRVETKFFPTIRFAPSPYGCRANP